MKKNTLITIISIFLLFIIVIVGSRYFGQCMGQRVLEQKLEKQIAENINESKISNIPSTFDEIINQQPYFFKLCARETPEKIESEIELNNIDVNMENSLHQTPIIYSAMFNPNPGVISFLIKKGAIKDIYLGEENLLMVACKTNKAIIIKELIKIGFNVNDGIPNLDKTPLMFACNYNKDSEVIKVLIEAGADVNIQQKGGLYNGYTPLMYACKMFAGGNIEKLKLLLNAGANINTKNAQGETALTIAKKEINEEEFITYLINHGAE